MTAYAFGLKTPRAFLAKARREVERLAEIEDRASSLADVALVQDTAINAALTLWHVADWVARWPDPAYVAAIERIRVERPSLKKARLEIVREHIRDSSHMVLCEALANGAKHFELYERPSLDSTRLFTTSGPFGGTAAVTVEADVTVRASVDAAIPFYFAKLKINGEGLRALEVFKGALAYWDNFFTTYGL